MKKLFKKKKSSYDNPNQAALDWYFAGIIDGEGCVAIQKTNHPHGPIYSPAISVGMVNKEILELLYNTYGGQFREERVSQNRQKIYRWRLQKRKDVLNFCKVIKGKLKEKHRQLENIIDFIENEIPNQFSRRKLSAEELQRRERLYLKNRELNAVGAGATTKRFDSREAEAIV